MADISVIHRQLGVAQLLRTLDAGTLWEVRFDRTNQRAILPAAAFDPLDGTPPDNRDLLRRFHHRQALEALRFGIVPIVDVSELTIGLEPEKLNLKRSLDRSVESGGDVIAVLANYGFGKSHFIELAAQDALADNFLVALASLDLVEVPPGKAREIYKALVASIRYPNSELRGLTPLLDQAIAQPEALHNFLARQPIDDDPLCMALRVLASCDDPDAREGIIEWLSGLVNTPNEAAKRFLKHPPKLYIQGEVARQYAYILTGLSVLATTLGYAGLAVLIDESEHYALLNKTQHERADSFFKSMIYAASDSAIAPDDRRIDLESIPNNTRADYPVTFATPTNLFFMFASTEIIDQKTRMPLESWLAPAQTMRLDSRFVKNDLLKFVGTILRYHGIAYSYAPLEERYKPLLEKTAGVLSNALGKGKLTLRQVIKLTVTVCDLMYAYPDYAPDTLIDELTRGLSL